MTPPSGKQQFTTHNLSHLIGVPDSSNFAREQDAMTVKSWRDPVQRVHLHREAKGSRFQGTQIITPDL